MQLIEVTDFDHEDLRIYKTMRANAFDKEGSFVADSEKVVIQLLRAGAEVKSILAVPSFYEKHAKLLQSYTDCTFYVADKKHMQRIVGHKLHQGIMMHGLRPQPAPLEKLGANIVMVRQFANMESVGAIARSMAAFGVDSYLLSTSTPHPYSRRALRVSMGQVSRLQIQVYDDFAQTIAKLKALGYCIIGAEMDARAQWLGEFTPPKKWVLLLGHEGQGLDEEALKLCDFIVAVEMDAAVGSLNVTAAAAVIMHHFKMR